LLAWPIDPAAAAGGGDSRLRVGLDGYVAGATTKLVARES